MTWLSPERLWLLTGVAALTVGYLIDGSASAWCRNSAGAQAGAGTGRGRVPASALPQANQAIPASTTTATAR